MQIKYLDFWRNESSFIIQAKTLRAAYLLADEIYLGGEQALQLMTYQKPAQFSNKQRVSIAYAHAIRDGKNSESAVLFESLYKEMKKPEEAAKLPKDKFIKYKKLENSIQKVYNKDIEYINQKIELTDLKGMHEFIGTANFKTGLLEISSLNALPLNQQPEKIALKILDFIFGNDDPRQPSILLIDFSFFGNIKEQKNETNNEEKSDEPSFVGVPKTLEEYYNIYCADEKNIEEKLLQNCLRIPGLHNLNTNELRELKKQLSEPLATFNQSMNEWIMVRKHQIEEKEPMGISHFNLLKGSSELAKAINQIPLLQVSNADNPGSPDKLLTLAITTCLAPTQDFWEHFEDHAFIQPEVIAALRKLTDNNPAYPKRIPLIAMLIEIDADKNEILNEMDDKTKSTAFSKKKSMDLEE